jgi:hypothetical protein
MFRTPSFGPSLRRLVLWFTHAFPAARLGLLLFGLLSSLGLLDLRPILLRLSLGLLNLRSRWLRLLSLLRQNLRLMLLPLWLLDLRSLLLPWGSLGLGLSW